MSPAANIIVGPELQTAARDLILNFLRSNIQAQIDSPDNQVSDEARLEPPEQFYISEKFISLQPPALYVLKDGPMAFDNSDNPNMTKGKAKYRVIISVEHPGADLLELITERWNRIIYNLLDRAQLKSDDERLLLSLTVDSIDESDLMARKNGETGEIYRKDAICNIVAKHYEARIASISP